MSECSLYEIFRVEVDRRFDMPALKFVLEAAIDEDHSRDVGADLSKKKICELNERRSKGCSGKYLFRTVSAEIHGKSGTSEFVMVGKTGIFSKSIVASGESGAGFVATTAWLVAGRFAFSAAILKDDDGGLVEGTWGTTVVTAGITDEKLGEEGGEEVIGMALLALTSAARPRRVSEGTKGSMELELLVNRLGIVQIPALDPERSRIGTSTR